jgi:hypothetical protein
MDRQELCYMILSFLFIATFIVIFFFTYVSKVEEKIIVSHVEKMTSDMFEETDLFLQPEQKELISLIIKNNKPKIPDSILEDDKRVEENNKELLDKSIKIFSGIVIIGLIIIAILYYKSKEPINLRRVIRNSLIVLIFIAVLEFCFVRIISQNYILIDSNLFKSLFFKKLSEYANSN